MEDILKSASSYIGNSTYSWVPILVFVLVMLLAMGMGFLNGWKTSLYFFAWNLVGYIVITVVLLEVPNLFRIFGSSSVAAFITALKDWSGPVIIFASLLVINFFAFIIYLFIRKRLKQSMKLKKSNATSRVVGMSIATVSVLPIAVFFTTSSSLLSSETAFTNAFDTVTNYFSFGNYNGSKPARALADNATVVKNLIVSIGGKSTDQIKSELTTPESKKDLEDLLNSGFASRIGDLYVAANMLLSGDDELNIPKDITVEQINDNVPKMGLDINKDIQSDLKASLASDTFGLQSDVITALFDQLFASPISTLA